MVLVSDWVWNWVSTNPNFLVPSEIFKWCKGSLAGEVSFIQPWLRSGKIVGQATQNPRLGKYKNKTHSQLTALPDELIMAIVMYGLLFGIRLVLNRFPDLS